MLASNGRRSDWRGLAEGELVIAAPTHSRSAAKTDDEFAVSFLSACQSKGENLAQRNSVDDLIQVCGRERQAAFQLSLSS